MEVAERMPKRFRWDKSSFELRIEPGLPLHEGGKWWNCNPGKVKNKLSRRGKGSRRD